MQGRFIIVRSAKLKTGRMNISQESKYSNGLITDFKRLVLIDKCLAEGCANEATFFVHHADSQSYCLSSEGYFVSVSQLSQ
jgi:hypothetical protein